MLVRKNWVIYMQFQGKRVLILEGYARQSLALVQAFNKLSCNVSVLCGSKLDLCYWSRYVNKRILGICDRDLVKETEEQVRMLIQSHDYDVVVPATDFSAELLSRNKDEFSKYARIASNEFNVYSIAGNKNETMKVCESIGVPHPKTLQNIESVEAIEESDIRFPVVIKPSVGYGAIGFKKVDTLEDLKESFKNKTDFSNYVIQEYIPQTDLQYECAMFLDDNNEVKTSLVFSKNRWFPVNGGSSTLNITVLRPDIVDSCTKLLKAINWRGPADIDLIQDPRDGKAKIMEINPRVSGSVKICFLSGVDQAKQMLELAYHEKVTHFKEYKIGQRLRCSQTDFLWFLTSPNRFNSNPSWFSCRNTSDQIFDIHDPLPWFSFSIQKLLQLRKELKKR